MMDLNGSATQIEILNFTVEDAAVNLVALPTGSTLRPSG